MAISHLRPSPILAHTAHTPHTAHTQMLAHYFRYAYLRNHFLTNFTDCGFTVGPPSAFCAMQLVAPVHFENSGPVFKGLAEEYKQRVGTIEISIDEGGDEGGDEGSDEGSDESGGEDEDVDMEDEERAVEEDWEDESAKIMAAIEKNNIMRVTNQTSIVDGTVMTIEMIGTKHYPLDKIPILHEDCMFPAVILSTPKVDYMCRVVAYEVFDSGKREMMCECVEKSKSRGGWNCAVDIDDPSGENGYAFAVPRNAV